MQTVNPEHGLLIWTALAAVMFFIFLAAFINVLKSDFTDSTTKLMWVLVILLVPFLGSIIYFMIGGRHKVLKANWNQNIFSMKKAWIISFVIVIVSIVISMLIEKKYIFYELIIVFATIQVSGIILVYITAKRAGSHEISLTARHFPIGLKRMVTVISAQVAFLVLVIFISKQMDKGLLFFLIPIVIISSIIQYIIVKGKKIPSFFIEGNHLFVNDFNLRKYNLQDLQSIKLNGFTEVYTAEFNGKKKIKLNQDLFNEEAFNDFLAAMFNKSGHQVPLSENISGRWMMEFIAAAIYTNIAYI